MVAPALTKRPDRRTRDKPTLLHSRHGSASLPSGPRSHRGRYLERLTFLADVLTRWGCPTELPEGAFYLWVPVPEWATEEASRDQGSAGWVLAAALAEAAGMLVSPGDLYGQRSDGFVRIAVVQPDDRIELVASRLAVTDDPRLQPVAR